MELIKKLFTFKNRERKGIITLLVIIFILIIIRSTNLLNYKHTDYDYSELEQKVKEFEAQLEEKTTNEKLSGKSLKESKQEFELFVFDPNTISSKELKKLGFSTKQEKTIINYRKSGGKFHKKEDFKKIYSVSDEKYNELKDYIYINVAEAIPNKQNEKEEDVLTESHEVVLVELNSADSIDLLDLYGVGSVYSNRIIRYRNLLGGFFRKDQLKEVYGISDSTYNLIADKVEVDPGLITFIDLNEADYKELVRHPYITKYNAKAILKYIDLMGEVKDKRDLLENEVLSESDYNKISPYIGVK